jgi:hypothetical protein
MQNNNLTNQSYEDEIDLSALVKTLVNYKTSIILITLSFLLLTLIYLWQKESDYESNILLEIGSYELISGEDIMIQPISDLIKELRIDLIYKQGVEKDKLQFLAIEGKLLKIIYISPSPENNQNLLKEATIFIQDRHANIQAKITSSLNNKIQSINNQLDFINNSLAIKKETKKIEINNRIISIDTEINTLKSKINSLSQLIPQEQNNLNLLKSDSNALIKRIGYSPTLEQLIYTYKGELSFAEAEIQNLLVKKDDLEKKLISIEKGDLMSKELLEDGDLISEELYVLNQEKINLERKFKLDQNNKNTTQVLHEIKTKEINNNMLTILLGIIFGFLFSVILVYVRELRRK